LKVVPRLESFPGKGEGGSSKRRTRRKVILRFKGKVRKRPNKDAKTEKGKTDTEGNRLGEKIKQESMCL